MAKYGVSLKIDVSKIDKSKMFKGEKGVYLDATVFIDVDNKGQHGDNGMIVQSWKDAPKGQTPILGNATVFWSDGGQPQQPQPQQQRPQQNQNQNQPPPMAEPDYDDDIPF